MQPSSNQVFALELGGLLRFASCAVVGNEATYLPVPAAELEKVPPTN